MIDRIKAALNNTIWWFIALFGGLAYFWVKTRNLEDKLEEEKADATLKVEKVAVHDADVQSDVSREHYADIRKRFSDENPE